MPHYNKQMISLFLTTKCNLRCQYCYNSSERKCKKEQSLSLTMAKVGIKTFFQSNSSRHIRFYGPGEPTQEFQLLKDIVKYAMSEFNEYYKNSKKSNKSYYINIAENIRREMNEQNK